MVTKFPLPVTYKSLYIFRYIDFTFITTFDLKSFSISIYFTGCFFKGGKKFEGPLDKQLLP